MRRTQYVHAPTQCYGLLKHIDVFFSTTEKQDVNEIKLLYTPMNGGKSIYIPTHMKMLSGHRTFFPS